MSDENQTESEETTEETEQSLLPVKTPERIRQEELFLWPWRIMILIGTVWAGIYGWIGLTAPIERLEYLASETVHGSMQIGVTIFLGAELIYYLYISAAFRSCREWGMILWCFGMIAVAMNLKFGI